MTVTEWNDHVGVGWRPLLQQLHDELVAAGISYKTLQVKEKWGVLRVYISVEGESYPVVDMTFPGVGTITSRGPLDDEQPTSKWQQAQALVRKYENKSATVCEYCGDPGELRNSHYWMLTLCDACESVRTL